MDVCDLETIDPRRLSSEERSAMDMVVCVSSEQKLLKYEDAINYLQPYIIPTGFVLDWVGDGTPDSLGDWLVCDGSTFSETEYPKLYKVLGGDTLPDFRGRLTIGSDFGEVGDTRGDYTKLIELEHLPPHNHEYEDWIGGKPDGTLGDDSSTSSSNRPFPRTIRNKPPTLDVRTTALPDTPSQRIPLELIQPTVIVKKIIKAN